MGRLRDRDRTPLPLFDRAILGGDGPSEEFAGQADSPLAVLVLGPPGSGKGTQAGLLSDRMQLPHVSTGDLLRARILIGDELGLEIARRIDVGQFVPDALINRMLDERMLQADCRRGVILDGYPRTAAQAKRLIGRLRDIGWATVVARLVATEELLAARFSGRRQCAECGALFHLSYQPSLAGDSCDRPGCFGSLQVRADDRPEFIARRLADFEKLTSPVIALLESLAEGLVLADAGAGSPLEIHDRIFRGILGVIEGPQVLAAQESVTDGFERGVPGASGHEDPAELDDE